MIRFLVALLVFGLLIERAPLAWTQADQESVLANEAEFTRLRLERETQQAEELARLRVAQEPQGLSNDLRALISAAIESGDDKSIKLVLDLARKVANDPALTEISLIEKEWKKHKDMAFALAETERVERLRRAGLFENWKGRVEFGAFRSTGTTTNVGAVGTLELVRESQQWTHKLTARGNIEEKVGKRTVERLFASWQPNYRLSQRHYAYGLAQFEHDPFSGFNDRYTMGVGIGVSPVFHPKMKLDFEGGPAVRSTQVGGLGHEMHVVGRGALNFRWDIAPSLQFSHKADIFLEKEANNAILVTAIDTKLIGNLQTRISYNVQYESHKLDDRTPFNTQSRVTFAYVF